MLMYYHQLLKPVMPSHPARRRTRPSHYVEILHNELQKKFICRITVHAVMLSGKICMSHSAYQHPQSCMIIWPRINAGSMVMCYKVITPTLVPDKYFSCCFLVVCVFVLLDHGTSQDYPKNGAVNYSFTLSMLLSSQNLEIFWCLRNHNQCQKKTQKNKIKYNSFIPSFFLLFRQIQFLDAVYKSGTPS